MFEMIFESNTEYIRVEGLEAAKLADSNNIMINEYHGIKIVAANQDYTSIHFTTADADNNSFLSRCFKKVSTSYLTLDNRSLNEEHALKAFIKLNNLNLFNYNDSKHIYTLNKEKVESFLLSIKNLHENVRTGQNNGFDSKIYIWLLQLGYDLYTNEIEKEVEKEYFKSEICDFNGHKWVKYFLDEGNTPHIQFAEGCHYKSVENLKDFENNVLEKYGEEKDFVYMQYMLIADTLRLKCKLPCRTIGMEIKICNFKSLFKQKETQIKKYIGDIDMESYYTPKNIMWLFAATDEGNEYFQYLESDSEDENYYYDLITVNYLDNNFAIPVPVLADTMQVEEKILHDCFAEHSNRNDVAFI